MWIQRRPSVSTVSTAGVSGSAGRETTSPRARANRPKRGLGRLGIGTSRVVVHWIRSGGQCTCVVACVRPVTGYTAAPHSSTHPEGWRDWPYEAPATPRYGGERAKSIKLPRKAGGFGLTVFWTPVHIPR